MASVIIGVKSRLGLLVGQATDVDGEHIVFEVVGQLAVGESMPFRVELSGADDTVLGDLRIVRLLSGRTGQLQRWVGVLTGVDPRYRQRFDEWVEDMQAGRSPWRLRKLAISGVMHGATEEETRTALDRMDARRSRLSKVTEGEGHWDEDTGEIFVQVDGLGDRAAPVTPARVAAAADPMNQDVLPDDPFVDSPTMSRVPAILAGEEPSSAQARVVPGGPLVVDADTGEVKTAPALIDVEPPRAFAFRDSDGPVLSVSWPDQRSLQQSVVDGLAAGFLALDHDAVAEWHSQARVQLTTPGGHDLRVQGQLLTRDGPQVLYRLELDAESLHVLMEEAGAALR